MVAPNNDDLVLDCALFFHSALPGRIGVISNDANLRLKVIAEQLPALSLSPTDSFTILLTALHPDLPAQFGLQPEAKQIDPVKHFDEEDMPMSDAPPVADIDDPDTLLAIISFTLNNHLPRIVHQQLVKALDQDTVEHLLRHFPPVDRWNSSTSLKVLEKHWSSLEYLWGDTEPVALSQAASGGTSVSQWSAAATTSKQPSQRLASDGLGLSRSQMRDFRQSSIPSLISLLEGTPSKSKKSSTRSQVNGASLSTYALGDHPASWSAAQWSTLWVDLELLLLRGRLLDDSLKSSASRATAQQWLQKWRTSSRSTCRR